MKKFAPLLIVLAVLASYAPAVRNGFVWDDTALVLRDPLIRSWRLIPEGMQHFLFTDATPSDFFRPVQRLTYTLEYWAFIFRPAAYHVTNILIHCAAALALYMLALELLNVTAFSENRRRWSALAAAMLWAVHPAHSAVVAYVSGRADSLAAAFGFFALYLALKAGKSDREQAIKLYGGAALLVLFSALSKESGLVFAAILIFMTLIRRDWRGVRYALIATAFVATIYVTLRAQADRVEVPQLHAATPALVRPILAARAVAEYSKILFWPRNLHMERTVATHPSGFNEGSITNASMLELQTLAGIVIAALFGWYLWRLRRSDSAAFVSLGCAVVAYLPISGLFGLNATVAEHWLYVPMAFFLIALSSEIALRLRTARAAVFITTISALLAVALGTRSFLRCFDWKDQRTFLEATIAAGGDSPRMLINLAMLESGDNHLDRAKELLEIALRKDAEQPFALVNLAAVLLRRNDLVGARNVLERAIKSSVVEARAQQLLSILDNKESGKADLRRLRLASRTGPPDWDIERRYIRALIETGAVPAAIAELRSTLQTQWYRADTWSVLGDLLVRTGYVDEGEEALRVANEYDVHLQSH